MFRVIWCFGTILILVLTALLSVWTEMPIRYLTQDPNFVDFEFPLVGFLSNIGIVLWSFCVAFCLLSFSLISNGEMKGLMACFGILSAYLLFDDLFMFHDFFLPDYLGGHEDLVILALAAFVAMIVIRYRKQLMATPFPLAVLAGAFLASSVAIDQIADLAFMRDLDAWRYYVEDAPKFIGISLFTLYLLETGVMTASQPAHTA